MNDGLPPGLAERLDATFRCDPHANHLGIELVDWSEGAAMVSCALADHHTNFLGSGHGGLIFSLADVAMSVASNSHGRVAVAVQIDISYLRRVDPGDQLTATATVTNTSRRFTHVGLDVHVGERKVAAATGITYRTDDWHFGADAWPEAWRSIH